MRKTDLIYGINNHIVCNRKSILYEIKYYLSGFYQAVAPVADFLPCLIRHGLPPIIKLKIIVYEKDKHGQDGNVSNGIVRPFFATNIKSAE